MQYRVYNENNVKVTVTDKQLEEAYLCNGESLPIEIIIAMGASRNQKFVPRLHEALQHPKQRVRIKAMHSLLSLNDVGSVPVLRKIDSAMPQDNYNSSISEKAILQSVIIRLEEGPVGVGKAFFSKDVHPAVKSNLLYNYSSNMVITVYDVNFIITALEVYLNKSEEWIQRMKKGDYEDDIIIGLEALWTAFEANSLPDNEFLEKLVIVGSTILNMKIDSYAKEVISIFSKYMPPQYAYIMLEPIMNGRAKGDVRKELEKSLLILRQEEGE